MQVVASSDFSFEKGSPGGGGNYHIRDVSFFGVPFFRVENKFCGIIFGKITSSHKFWGVILEK